MYVGNKRNDRKSMNVWGTYTGPAMPGERIYITRIKPIVGRYVTINRESNNNKAYLTLCEVFVLGNKGNVYDTICNHLIEIPMVSVYMYLTLNCFFWTIKVIFAKPLPIKMHIF